MLLFVHNVPVPLSNTQTTLGQVTRVRICYAVVISWQRTAVRTTLLQHENTPGSYIDDAILGNSLIFLLFVRPFICPMPVAMFPVEHYRPCGRKPIRRQYLKNRNNRYDHCPTVAQEGNY